jgi:hypothetical protein
MRSRSWPLLLISLGMIAYSVLVGRHLGSSFFLTAMCWGWVAVCGARGHLSAAHDMAVVMSALSLAAILLTLLGGHAAAQANLLSLGLLPSAVIWGCVILYVQHLRQGRRRPARRPSRQID